MRKTLITIVCVKYVHMCSASINGTPKCNLCATIPC